MTTPNEPRPNEAADLTMAQVTRFLQERGMVAVTRQAWEFASGRTALAAERAAGIDALGLSDEQTRNLREHLASRQQTLGEWISDVLFEMRLGRPDKIDYPPANVRLAGEQREETTP